MRESTKILLAIATFLLAAGMILFVVVMTLNHWDFKGLITVNCNEETHTVTEDFTNITVNAESADVEFRLSDDGTCKVLCKLPEKSTHTVAVEDGTLKIGFTDETKWYDYIGFTNTTSDFIVYLPKKAYRNYTSESQSGDVEISKDLTFESVKIQTKSGDVSLDGVTARLLRIDTSSGDVDLARVAVTEEALINTSSGDVTCEFLGPVRCSAKSKSGDINVPDNSAPGAENEVVCDIRTRSGDIRITTSDAPTPTPTEAPATPSPTEAATGLTVRYLMSNPEANTAPFAANLINPLVIPADATLKVTVKRTGEETAYLNGATVGGISFDSETPDEKYLFTLDHSPKVGETITFDFPVSDIVSSAEAVDCKKLFVIVTDNIGYTLVGVDVEYAQ
ncbi:MAG: DUF4097 family beta strand repeat protein [Lachnospiraceae bacterium]|nr:DUF4097 family beta strand repeat protein [Lachnospiraceae bacterium]